MPTTEAAPSILLIACAIASARGLSSFAIIAAITSLSDVDESGMPSSARSAAAFTMLPLWPSATVRVLP